MSFRSNTSAAFSHQPYEVASRSVRQCVASPYLPLPLQGHNAPHLWLWLCCLFPASKAMHSDRSKLLSGSLFFRIVCCLMYLASPWQALVLRWGSRSVGQASRISLCSPGWPQTHLTFLLLLAKYQNCDYEPPCQAKHQASGDLWFILFCDCFMLALHIVPGFLYY